jgi:hypothetical protein
LPAAGNQRRPLFAVADPDRCGPGGKGLTRPVDSLTGGAASALRGQEEVPTHAAMEGP